MLYLLKWMLEIYHFQKMGLVKILECSEHPKGREFWLDSIRWRIESGDKMEDFIKEV